MLNEILTANEYSKIKTNVINLLNQYDYEYSEDAIDTIINVWSKDKKDLINAFKKHPNYVEGEFLIAFKSNFNRALDVKALNSFADWLTNSAIHTMKETLPEDIKEKTAAEHCMYLPSEMYNTLTCVSGYDNPMLTQEQAEALLQVFPFSYAHKGQKTSRVINKICQYLGYDKHPDYNREYAKYSDALSPITVAKTVVLSINPMDYLTMSFGNSWASCHTIDKKNKRAMPNSYSGCYSSGTISYMLDQVSMVFYTVNNDYEGTEFYTQDKINRQMFHYGEDKLIQGRLYPQSNDSDGSSYEPYRNIVQQIVSTIEGFDNRWVLKRGTSEISEYVCSEGTHYRDYTSFDNCTISIKKDSINGAIVHIGHDPICIQCGYEHDRENNIVCEDCTKDVYYCASCGEQLDENNVIWIDGDPYCENCCFYCDECDNYYIGEGNWVEAEDRYVCDNCYEEYYYSCAECGEIHHKDNMIWIDEIDDYVCDDCYANCYRCCEECGDEHHKDNMIEIDGNYYCEDCAAKIQKEEENEEVEENEEN